MIIKFEDFINEKMSLLESVEIQNLKLVLSDKLIEKLKLIDHYISDELLKMHNDNEGELELSFIDVDKNKDDVWSYILVNKAKLLLYDEDLNDLKSLFKDKHNVYSKYRVEVKVGRVIKKIFGDKFPETKNRNITELKGNDIESFVNLYKSVYNDETLNLFDIVSGRVMIHYYDESNYYNEDGSLGGSCMRYDSCADYINFYATNNKCRLLILRDSDNKNLIKGRALLWTLDEPNGRIFMDRIYTNNYSDETYFKQYAKENGFLFKSEQSFSNGIQIIDTNNNTKMQMYLRVNLNDNVDTEHFPYVDTLSFYNDDEHYIANSGNECKFRLNSTEGDMNDNEYYEGVVEMKWSEYHQENIPENRAKWCDIGQDWVYENEAVYISNTNPRGRYAVPDSDLIVKSNYSNKWFLKERCVYSEYLKDWIFEDSIRKIYKDENSESFDIIHKKEKQKLIDDEKIIKKDNKYYWL